MASAAPVTEAAPSAPPAAPPSAPSGGGSQSPDDQLESLRQNTIAWGHNAGKTSEPNSEPAVQTAEGSTPPTEAPATVAPSTAHEDWIKRYGDPEKAAQEAFALEQRHAATVRELKELKAAQPSPTTLAPAQPVATAPAPAPTPQATAPQAQPAQPQATPSVQDQALEYALTQDAQCRDLVKQHNTNVATLKGLYDPETGAGEIPTLRQQIANSNAVIAHPDVDELVKDNARAALQRSEMQLAAREATFSRLNLDNKSLDMDFRARVGGYVSQLEGQSAERAREAEFEKEADTKAQEFVKNWPSAFDPEFVKSGLDPELRDKVHAYAKVVALARPGRIDIADLPTFMAETIKDYAGQVDTHHRLQARKYALQKNADVAPAATTDTAAVTAPPTSQTDDPEAALERLRLGTRQAFKARGAR